MLELAKACFKPNPRPGNLTRSSYPTKLYVPFTCSDNCLFKLKEVPAIVHSQRKCTTGKPFFCCQLRYWKLTTFVFKAFSRRFYQIVFKIEDRVFKQFPILILVLEKASIDGSRVANSKKNDGLGRIRTGDLRHVKAGDLGLCDAFPVGEITTRKASAPS